MDVATVNTDTLKQLLSLEATYKLSDAVMDEFLAGAVTIQLSTYEPMIDAGKYDPNIYIVKQGLIRGTYLDGNMEKTAGFALPGTLVLSFHCYYGGEPSYYRFEACCASEVLRIPKEYFESLIARSHEFAIWVMSAHQNQLYYNESKNQVLSGDARSRLVQLTRRLQGILSPSAHDTEQSPASDEPHAVRVRKELYCRWNEIFRIVPSRIIASYLGITEQHLSKIKKEVLLSI